MALPKPTIVIFDMDGTSVRHLNPAVLNTLEWLDNILHRISSVSSWLFRRKAQGNPMEDWESYYAKKKPRLLVTRALHKMRKRGVDEFVEPCPGIYDTLNLLRSKRIPMALASNGLGKGYGHEVLQRFGLVKYFQATIFREDIHKSKPHPDAILLALKETGIELKPEDTIWYIGDRSKDIKAALAAAPHLPCTIIALAYGISATLEVFRQNLSPDHIIPTYADITERLKKLLA